jgi:hypothetical protein
VSRRSSHPRYYWYVEGSGPPVIAKITRTDDEEIVTFAGDSVLHPKQELRGNFREPVPLPPQGFPWLFTALVGFLLLLVAGVFTIGVT